MKEERTSPRDRSDHTRTIVARGTAHTRNIGFRPFPVLSSSSRDLPKAYQSTGIVAMAVYCRLANANLAAMPTTRCSIAFNPAHQAVKPMSTAI
jgi:hypothetical protein